MAKSTEGVVETKPNGVVKIAMPDGREVSIKKARALMAELTEEAEDLKQDETAGAKAKRADIARQLRAIQKAIDATEEIVEVEIPANASRQFPFYVGPRAFGPGVHKVRKSVAQVLRYQMDQHKQTESGLHESRGNATEPGSLGRELPAI